MAYYDNPGMLREHFNFWRFLDGAFSRGLQIVVVDDGSPDSPAKEVFQSETFSDGMKRGISLYRIHEDKPWNQDGARNLAMKVCKPQWTLLHDIDHLVPLECVKEIMDMPKERGSFYIPERIDAETQKPLDPHANTYIIHPRDYWRTGGMDEDFVGYWGTDSFFRRQLLYRLKEASCSAKMVAVTPEHVPDCNTRRYGRRRTPYSLSRSRRKMPTQKYKPDHPLRFSWERVY